MVCGEAKWADAQAAMSALTIQKQFAHYTVRAGDFKVGAIRGLNTRSGFARCITR